MTYLAARSAAINSSRLGLNNIAELRLGEFKALLAAVQRQGLVFSPGEIAMIEAPQ
jgi:hypothetical protein